MSTISATFGRSIIGASLSAEIDLEASHFLRAHSGTDPPSVPVPLGFQSTIVRPASELRFHRRRSSSLC